MLTFLDILNRLLGYFNIQDKAKGKAFTIVAFVANFYLLYAAIQGLRFPGYRIQGALFLAGFLVLEYFIVLNFFYYYTDKQLKFDISPKIEKALGGNQAQIKAAENQLAQTTMSGPASGLFQDDKLLPTAVLVSPTQQTNLEALVERLVQQGNLAANYSGLDERAIARVAQKTHQPVAALGTLVELPFFELRDESGQLTVYAGVNSLSAVPVATVQRVGLLPAKAAQNEYQLAAAHVYLTGGESKQMGRRTLITRHEPYSVTVQLAYRAHDTNK
ncbi:DUF6681 family protein [Lacticaseibacillus baoqingensis]|uniref:DUF6681 family protein n=1 Tax=Lacticaseibacillus baoqingensis TaxID=2486013 RepID=A0ABW4E1H7_9LACO|nr:DUF6681 family protein [Lacticaseibacillus baoqingensis]